MTFSELIQARHSVRGYLDTPVPDDLLMKVLDAGRLAPSACNNQPWVFIVVRNRENVEALRSVYNRDWFVSAPVVIVVCLDHEKNWKRSDGRDYGDVDIAIAADHMVLQATELGLGTCWIGAFNLAAARATLKLPDTIEPLIATPLGWPAHQPQTKKRKPLTELLHFEKFAGYA